MTDNDQEEEVETYVTGFVKFSLCFFNFLMWIWGLFLVGIGIWATVEEQRYGPFTSDLKLVDISVGIILVGIVVFLIPMIGFLGAIRENVLLLRIFGAVVIVTVCLEILLVVLVFVFWNDIKASTTAYVLQNFIVKYYDSQDGRFILDFAQERVGCCGISTSGYRDWNTNIYHNCSNMNPSPFRCGVPFSCCKQDYRATNLIDNYMCGFGAQNLTVLTAGSRIYTKGCIQAFVDWIKENAYAIGGVMMGIALCQIVSFAMADYMIAKIKRFCKDCEAGTVKRRRPKKRRRRRRSSKEHEEP